jgi:Arc/MetJ-type ribon-helix-helix transcriptional regulator
MYLTEIYLSDILTNSRYLKGVSKMVNTRKINFTIPVDLVNELQTQVKKSKRSAFVAEAIRDKLAQMKKQQLEHDLAEGYQARQVENARLAVDWADTAADKWE